jgi:catechol 2,3-dioxygenase-like lactoylglutathione lyase family enzyme
MAVRIVGMIHAGVRVAPDEASVARAAEIYGGLLGFQADGARPDIPGVPGFWFNIGAHPGALQIHVMGAEGVSPVARTAQQDPARPHLAFAVEDLEEAKRELERRGIAFWIFGGLVGPASELVLFEDGCGNMLEFQQAPGRGARGKRESGAG